MKLKTCVIAGALGIAGRALIEHLERSEDWRVIGLSRRQPDFETLAQFITVDLLNLDECRAKLGGLSDITHIFYAAHVGGRTPAEEVAPNLAMLSNLVSTVEASSQCLRRIVVLHGTKWYGNHLGPFRTPAREDDPRHMPPNFYYDQQDWIAARQQGKRWEWVTLRPHGFCGISIGSPMNHLMGLALYAAISRELGLQLRFPGAPGAFRAITQFTDAGLLARAMVWAATAPGCSNQAFNMTNGEYERWENLWPDIAECFDLRAGPVQSISLEKFMADKEALWATMCERYELRRYRLAQLVDWRFIDWSYSNGFDQMSSLNKARQAGWHESLNADVMFRRLFRRLADDRIIPTLP